MTTGISWLDVKLGARMLIKHPGLTVVGGFGMAVAIAIGAAAFEFISTMLDPALPLPGGDRVVSIFNATQNVGNPERRVLHDFVTWREELASVEHLSAFTGVARNLVTGEGEAQQVSVIEMTASGFEVASTPPLLGRTLVPADEAEGAPAVIVLGHQVWQSRFGGDPGVVGSSVGVDGVPHTVVGVMPEGFRFPVDNQYWTPLKKDPSDYARLEGPSLEVFGRLAPGVSMQQAQAELTRISERTAEAHPATHEQLRARVASYTRAFVDMDHPAIVAAMRTLQILVGLLLIVVAVTVAILIYARTVARIGEMAVRNALGASRRRIVMQLFVEALVLASIAAVLGLVIARAALRQIEGYMGSVGGIPFWLSLELSTATVVYVLALTLVAAFVVGVLPGLKATGGQLHGALRDLGGGTSLRLGRTWTLLIVVQVAIAVFVLPAALFMAWDVRPGAGDPGIPADRIYTTRVALNAGMYGSEETDEFRAQLASRQAELARRLEAEPGVAAVALSFRVPGQELPGRIEMEREGEGEGEASSAEVSGQAPVVHALPVGLGVFEAYAVEVLTGRTFQEEDVTAEVRPVVVNRTFAEHHSEAGPVLGRRFRYTRMHPGQPELGSDEAWHEIIGVVRDFPAYRVESGSSSAPVATAYHPIAPGELNPVTLSARLGAATPAGFTRRLSEIALAVDPALRLREPEPVAAVYDRMRFGMRMAAWGLGAITLSVLLLAVAGTYALLSFTILRRTREIGIRAALGAQHGRLLADVLGTALRQLALGAAIGSLLGGGLILGMGVPPGTAALVLLAVALLCLGTGVLAALGPARRGLRIQPTEAIRAEG